MWGRDVSQRSLMGKLEDSQVIGEPVSTALFPETGKFAENREQLAPTN